MHLNQFYHVECELAADFNKCISVAEQYLYSFVTVLVEECSDSVRALAGGITHLQAFVDRCRRDDGRLLRITLDQALTLPGMDESTWKFAVPSQPDKGRCITCAGGTSAHQAL